MSRFLETQKRVIMDIRSLGWLVGISFLLTSFVSEQKTKSLELDEYKFLKTFTPIANHVIGELVLEDQKLYFILFFENENDTITVSITTCYDLSADYKPMGFSKYRDKMFFIEGDIESVFLERLGDSKISFRVQQEELEVDNGIPPSYIDVLPFWQIKYFEGEFKVVISHLKEGI